MLTVHTPPVFMYYSHIILRADVGAPAISHISLTENGAISLLRYLATARDGAGALLGIDCQMGGNGEGVVVSLQPDVRR